MYSAQVMKFFTKAASTLASLKNLSADLGGRLFKLNKTQEAEKDELRQRIKQWLEFDVTYRLKFARVKDCESLYKEAIKDIKQIKVNLNDTEYLGKIKSHSENTLNNILDTLYIFKEFIPEGKIKVLNEIIEEVKVLCSDKINPEQIQKTMKQIQNNIDTDEIPDEFLEILSGYNRTLRLVTDRHIDKKLRAKENTNAEKNRQIEAVKNRYDEIQRAYKDVLNQINTVKIAIIKPPPTEDELLEEAIHEWLENNDTDEELNYADLKIYTRDQIYYFKKKIQTNKYIPKHPEVTDYILNHKVIYKEEGTNDR